MLRKTSKGPILYVELDRPDVRNAINDEVIHELFLTFSELPTTYRAVVLSGAGKAFCAGGDLNWMTKASNYSDEENIRDAIALSRLFRSIVECHAVVLAKVHGSCFGGGCGLACSADVTFVAEDTKFSFSEIKLGLIPATISPIVIDKLGKGNARWLFSTGEVFGADIAKQVGLAQVVAPAEELDSLIDARLKSILASGPSAVNLTKQLVYDGPMGGDDCARLLARARASEEGREGVAAFLGKRKASFVVDFDSLKDSKVQ